MYKNQGEFRPKMYIFQGNFGVKMYKNQGKPHDSTHDSTHFNFSESIESYFYFF